MKAQPQFVVVEKMREASMLTAFPDRMEEADGNRWPMWGAALSIGGHAVLISLFLARSPAPRDPPIHDTRITVTLFGPQAPATTHSPDRSSPLIGRVDVPAPVFTSFPSRTDSHSPALPVVKAYPGETQPLAGEMGYSMDQANIHVDQPAPVADSIVVDRWEEAVLQSLERRKRYPPDARSAGLEDIVYVRIRVDRSGKVLASSISHSHGLAGLDRAALDLVRRANPLPAPPDSLSDSALEFVVPLDYSLEEGRQ
jgi:protein TonB